MNNAADYLLYLFPRGFDAKELLEVPLNHFITYRVYNHEGIKK